jgi:hypothetical protein
MVGTITSGARPAHDLAKARISSAVGCLEWIRIASAPAWW